MKVIWHHDPGVDRDAVRNGMKPLQRFGDELAGIVQMQTVGGYRPEQRLTMMRANRHVDATRRTIVVTTVAELFPKWMGFHSKRPHKMKRKL